MFCLNTVSDNINAHKASNSKIIATIINNKIQKAQLYDENGNLITGQEYYTTDTNGDYSLSGVVTGKEYFARFTYGNEDTTLITQINGEPVNARNYKSTIIVEDMMMVNN